jgi:hypothetical protein
MSKDMVAKNSDSKSTDHNSKRHKTVSPNTPEKFGRAQKRLRSMLVHVGGKFMLAVKVRDRAETFSCEMS